MVNYPRRFDSFWSGVESANLKKAVALWGGSSKLRKDECIVYLKAALNDPPRIDTALARMQPHERTVLGLLKRFDDALDIEALSVAARASGTVPAQERYIRSYYSDPIGKSLLERVIVMTVTGYRYISFSYSESAVLVFADERVLARVGPLECKPLPVTATEAPAHTLSRRAQSIVLDMISILRTVNDIGGIGLTKAGAPRTNDLRKVARKMGWGDRVEFDGLAFPEPARATISALTASNLLSQGSVVPLEQIVARPASELLRSLVSGLLNLQEWVEIDLGARHYGFKRYCPQGRLAVLTALQCLPDRHAWYRFEDFERALFDRIGETYSVVGVRHQPYSFRRSSAEEHDELDRWRQELRQSWEEADIRWLQAVFQTWLYAFGLVELSLVDGNVDRFRLTDVGRAVLWGAPSEEEARLPTEQAPPWIVQPNFDVVVYLENATTEQVAFLEQIAERLHVAQHTAQYRLTRDSVYAGLERGTGVDRLLDGLASGSRVALPSNVVTEIRTWAALRERITLRRRAELLEFPDAASRQSALERGVSGLEVGERFLLLPKGHEKIGKAALAGVTPAVIDYANEPLRCLQASEEGVITLVAEPRDLLTPGTLDLWARRESDAAWRLTRESVTAAIGRGRTLTELMTFLQSRLTQRMPAILTVALRAWAGEPAAAGMGEFVVLQCRQSDLLDALLTSQALKPYLLGRIGPDTILVDRANVDKVRAVLNWAGIQVSTKIAASRVI